MNVLCEHLLVTRGELDGAPIWTCTSCAAQFVLVPADEDEAEGV